MYVDKSFLTYQFDFLSTLFEDLLLRTGLIVGFKLLLDTLVGMTRKVTRRFERKK